MAVSRYDGVKGKLHILWLTRKTTCKGECNMEITLKNIGIISDSILLERGLLDENTILILDEPEIHLHPEWQNQFAELIVLLVKELKVKVLMTTHSSNFMLAIDAFMRKYGINEQTNFYQSEQLENGFVTHKCVNDHMELIYQDFLEGFSEVKVLRDCYISYQEFSGFLHTQTKTT